jgi:hypothetical protein
MTDAMWTAITGSPRPAPSLELANWDGGNAIYRLFPPIDAAAAPPAAVGQRPIAVDFKDGHSGLVLTPA